MIDDELIQKLAAALAAQLQPPIPVPIDLWDVATIARVLKRRESQVRNRLICLPDFPKAIRLPVESGGSKVAAWQFRKERQRCTFRLHIGCNPD